MVRSIFKEIKIIIWLLSPSLQYRKPGAPHCPLTWKISLVLSLELVFFALLGVPKGRQWQVMWLLSDSRSKRKCQLLLGRKMIFSEVGSMKSV